MKAKFKLSQLAAQDTVQKELVHPKHGETGIFVTLAGPSNQAWKEGLKKFRESEQDEAANLQLLASTVIGWKDEEAMEMPYTPENSLALLSNPANGWMVDDIAASVRSHSTFFL